MPVGPSHGSRGGSSFSGGGSHRSSNSSSSNSSSSSFLGAMIGGMIASTFSNKRRERFHTRYGYYPDEKDFQSMICTPYYKKSSDNLIAFENSKNIYVVLSVNKPDELYNLLKKYKVQD